MTDEFEAQVSRALRDALHADPAEVDRLRSYAAGLSATPHRAIQPAVLVAAVATVAAVMLVAAIGLGWLGLPSQGGNTTYPINSTDPRFAKCAGSVSDVLAAFPMEHAKDYRAYFPKMGISPELDSSQPAFVVVYLRQWPGPVLGPLTASGQSYSRPTLAPNHHDLCVWVGDSQTGTSYVLIDVDTTGMSAPPPATPSAAPASSGSALPGAIHAAASLPDTLTVCGRQWRKDPTMRQFSFTQIQSQSSGDPVVVDPGASIPCPTGACSQDAGNTPCATVIYVRAGADAYIGYELQGGP